VGVVDRGSVASKSRIKEVFARYGMQVGTAEGILVISSSPGYHLVKHLDWESLTDGGLEELAVSYSLELCFGNSSSYPHTNLCSEIYLPHGPKICTI
jgi:hypothetical protein